MGKNLTLRVNSNEKVEKLLQEIYDLATKNINEIQNEMNKLTTSCNFPDMTVKEKVDYDKAMHDFIGDKHKAILMKLDIAKLLSEIIKHNGSIDEAVAEPAIKKHTSLDLKQLQDAFKDCDSEEEVYKIS